jgi:hypothetical protein
MTADPLGTGPLRTGPLGTDPLGTDPATLAAAALLGLARPAHVPPSSRYAGVPTAQRTDAEGRTVTYFRRRRVPPPEALATTGYVRTQEGDRIDRLAGDVFGDPTLFWRLADANAVIRPADLVADPSRVLRVADPEGFPGAGRA